MNMKHNYAVVVLVANKASIGDYGTDSIREDYFYFAKEGETKGKAGSILFTQVIVNGAQNQKLSNQIGVPKGFQHPQLFIYPKNSKEAIPFPQYEKFNVATLTKFVSKYADFYYGIPGLVEPLTGIANKFARSDKETQEKLLNEADKIVTKVPDFEQKDSKYYLKAMKKILSDGIVYIQNELKRLDNVIESDKISDDKKRELARKRNIINQFHYDDDISTNHNEL
eukprot:gene20039-26019_t